MREESFGEVGSERIPPGSGNAERLVGLAMSQGSVQDLLKRGLSEQEVGLTKLREDAERLLGDESRSWYFSYRTRVGVK